MEPETLIAVERRCMDCGTLLGPGREDRKYCDSNCKTNFNNRRRREDQKSEAAIEVEAEQLSVPDYITRIQEILLHNRKILEGLCNEDKAASIRMRDLVGKGFNPKFFTSETEPTGTGKVYRFCFEFGYRLEENGFAVVICRKREVV
jgi:hypothetical protein